MIESHVAPGLVASVMHTLDVHSDAEVSVVYGTINGAPTIGLRVLIAADGAEPIALDRSVLNTNQLTPEVFHAWVAGYLSALVDVMDTDDAAAQPAVH